MVLEGQCPLPALTRQFSIGAVYVSPVMFENQSAGLAALRRSLADAGLTPIEIWSGDRLRTDHATRIDVVHPPRHGVLGSDNANSIVLAVEYAGRRLLLTGDLESPGLDDVLAEEPWDCDLLLAPHHGSAYSAAPKMAAWCRPEWTLVSGSEHDQAPAVQTAYGAYGQVLHTARQGAIQAVISPRGLDVRTWRGGVGLAQ